MAEGAGEVMAHHICTPVPAPSSLAPVTPLLEQIIVRALAKEPEPEQRFATAEQMIAALAAVVPSGPYPRVGPHEATVLAGPPPPAANPALSRSLPGRPRPTPVPPPTFQTTMSAAAGVAVTGPPHQRRAWVVPLTTLAVLAAAGGGFALVRGNAADDARVHAARTPEPLRGRFPPRSIARSGVACEPRERSCPAGTTCSTDLRCRVAGAGGMNDAAAERDDAGVELDAAIDAPPVGCAGDPDCATPPACLNPGTCDLSTHLCVFTPVDCSSLTDECNRGTCEVASGTCIKAPTNTGTHCGTGKVCGAFGACGGFDSACDTSGTQSRSCTENTCQSGFCMASTFNESQACDRTVSTCGTSTVTNCSACDYSSQCDQSAQQTCTCTDFNCQGASCVTSSSSCVLTCTRNTEGDPCGSCVSFRTRECQSGLCVTVDC